jgi:hypothetical protein
MAIYYLDGTSLSDSTAVFTDAELTVCATDGVYSNGVISRQLQNCILLPQQVCASCIPTPIACGAGVNPPSGNQGLYNLTFDAGDTVSDVGAIVIYFNPQSVPDGIRVLYDSVYYNSVSSPTSGRIQSTSGVADAFTLLGNSNACVPALPNTTSYNYFDGFTGSSWNTGTPTPQSITLNAGDDQYGGASEYSTLVIPKTSATPSDVSVQVLGPCSGTAWTVEVDCPITLPSFTASANIGSSINCTAASVTYYFAKHRGAVNTIPVLTSWVFSDSNGATVLTDGNYVMADNNVITIVSGVVTAIVVCTSAPLGHLMSDSISTSSGACSLPGTPTTTVYSSSFTVGGFVYLNSALSTIFVGDSGWYHISDFHTVYQINSSGEILDLLDCFALLYTISQCDTALLYTVANDFTFSLNDVVQFQVGTPGSGAIYCGTVTNLNSSGTADATLFSGSSYTCGDVVHCAT